MAPAPIGVELRQDADVMFCKKRNHPMHILTVGLDLAKDIVQVREITSPGEVVFNRAIKRKDLLAFFGLLPPRPLALEAIVLNYQRLDMHSLSIWATYPDLFNRRRDLDGGRGVSN